MCFSEKETSGNYSFSFPLNVNKILCLDLSSFKFCMTKYSGQNLKIKVIFKWCS